MQDFQEGSRRKGIVSKINLDIKRGEDRGVYYRRQLISLESDPTPDSFNRRQLISIRVSTNSSSL